MVNGRDLAVNTALLMANKTGESIFFLPIGNFDLTRHQHPTTRSFVGSLFSITDHRRYFSCLCRINHLENIYNFVKKASLYPNGLYVNDYCLI